MSVAALAAGHRLVLEPHGVAQIQELVQQPLPCHSPIPSPTVLCAEEGTLTALRFLIESPRGDLSEQTPARLSLSWLCSPRPVDDS